MSEDEKNQFEEFEIEDEDQSSTEFNLDDMDNDEGLDDSFLANFEDAMLTETETGATVQKVEIESSDLQAKLDPNVSENHTEQVIDMIERSKIDVDVKKVETIESIQHLEIDFDKIDLSAIDLAKLDISPLDPDNLKIGFDLNKLNLQDFDINMENVDIENIDFDKIQVDLGGLVSFEEAEKEIKKSNVLLPAPVKGFYGKLVLNPMQELRNAFGKSYNEILQIARPAEAYRRQIEEGIIIEANDIIKVHREKTEQEQNKAKKGKEVEAEVSLADLEAEKLADEELNNTLGKDWNKIEEKTKKEEEKEKKSIDPKDLILGFFRRIRSFYLRIFLISWTSKFLLVFHLVIGSIAVYYFSNNAMFIIQKIYSTRTSQQAEPVDSLEVIASKIKDPQKRILGPFASIPKLMGSFVDSNTEKGTRLFQMGIYIELENYDAQEELSSKSVMVKDKLLTFLNNVEYSNISSTLGKEKLKVELQTIINQNLKRGKAISIYYSDFVIN